MRVRDVRPEPAAPGTEAEVLPLVDEADVVRARHRVRDLAVGLRYDLVTQTKLVTATSELARNCLVHGGGGTMSVQRVDDGGRTGLRLVFRDDGPGIADVQQALTEGWSSGGGLGLGLSGSRRLVHDFAVETAPGRGTQVTVVVWQSPR